MIILDVEEDHSVKFDVAGSTIRYPDKVAGRSSSPLPDYEASEAQHRLVIRNLQSSTKKTRNTRILKATFYALAIYVALSAVIVLPIVLKRKSSQSDDVMRIPNPASLWINSEPIPSPPPSFDDTTIIPYSSSNADCSAWQKLVNHTSVLNATFQTTFSPSSSVSIRSNVSSNVFQVTKGVGGSLVVGINPDHKATQTVIQLGAQASNYTLLQQTNICTYQQDPNRGITIYVPSNLTDLQFLNFDVQLLFPKKLSPYTIPELITYLPQFGQNFASLSKTVTFSKVSIFGTMNDVVCQSLQAPIIGIKNVRAAITGNFNVSKSLILDTIYGPINTNITLTSITHSPAVVLDTGNGPIYAAITLSSTGSAKPNPPIFVSRVQTFAAPINLFFKNDAPTRPPLRLYAANTGAPTNVTLDAVYQGFFDIQTKLAPVSVTGPQNLSSSQFKITYDTQTYERLSGWIGSGSGPPQTFTDGQVEIMSALGPIALNFESGIS